jgi:hypothetical protein
VQANGKGIDHGRPADWSDHLVRVGDTELEMVWERAGDAGERMIHCHFPDSNTRTTQMARDFLCGKEKTHDFLRLDSPNGQARAQYVGIATTGTAKAKVARTSQFATQCSDGYETGSTTDSSSDSAPSSAPSHSSDHHHCAHSDTTIPPGTSDDELWHQKLGEAKASSVPMIQPLTSVPSFVVVGKAQVQKSSQVPALLSTHQKQSTDRNRRVQGQNRYDGPVRRPRLEQSKKPEIDDDIDAIEEGDLVASLVQCSLGQVCLVVLEVRHVQQELKGLKYDFLPYAELDAEDSKAIVSGQLLELEPVGDRQWAWTGEYIRKDAENRRTVSAALKSWLVPFSGKLISTIVPSIDQMGVHSWSAAELQTAFDDLWRLVNPPGTAELLTNVSLLPDLSSSLILPYLGGDGELLKCTSCI